MPTETKKEEIEVVVLKDGHTHAGKERKKDERLTVTQADAEWGIKHGVFSKPGKKEG